jgi:uncharacterized repeat protein (TIGR04076 family)
MPDNKVSKEKRWKKFQELTGYTDEELAIFRSYPQHVKAMENAPEFVKYKVVIEVLESHNCVSGYKAGDKFVVDHLGLLILDECPPKLCVGAISAFKPLVSKMWQAYYNGSVDVFQDIVRCPDVGVERGGTGEITMRVYAIPRDTKAAQP